MSRILRCLVIVGLAGCAPKEVPTTPHPQQLEVARRLAGALAAGNFERAEQQLAESLRRRLSARELERRWSTINDDFGPIVEFNGLRSTSVQGYQVLYLRGHVVERDDMDLRLVFAGQTEVVGLWFRPSSPTATYEPSSIPVGEQAAAPVDLDATTEAAIVLVHQLEANQFAMVTRAFDDTLRAQLSETQLAHTWRGLHQNLGALRSVSPRGSSNTSGLPQVQLDLELEQGAVVATFTFTPRRRLMAMAFTAADAHDDWQPPEVDRSAFKEVEVSLGEGEQVLRGTLTLPTKPEPAPAVLLVSGLGKVHRDLPAARGKLFKELAWLLAARGIASLRMDKGSGEATTWEDDFGNDTLAALELLRKRAEIDPGRVALVGHGWGGALAPKLASVDGRVAAVVIMSALPGGVSALLQDRDGIEASRRTTAKVWRSLQGYVPVEAAARLEVPVLVLVGGRDPLLRPEDVGLWQEHLGKASHHRVLRFDGLDHYLMATTDEAGAAQTPRVALDVVNAIVDGVQ